MIPVMDHEWERDLPGCLFGQLYNADAQCLHARSYEASLYSHNNVLVTCNCLDEGLDIHVFFEPYIWFHGNAAAACMEETEDACTGRIDDVVTKATKDVRASGAGIDDSWDAGVYANELGVRPPGIDTLGTHAEVDMGMQIDEAGSH